MTASELTIPKGTAGEPAIDETGARGISRVVSDVRLCMSSPRAVTVAFFAVVLVAGCLRLCDLGHNSLSHGEAGRFNWIDHGTIGDLRRFPPLAIPLSQVALALAGISEFGLRLPNALMGIACVVVLCIMVGRVFDAWSGVCVGAVAAVHPVLIYYGSRLAKEFSAEALFCALITWAGIETYRDPSHKKITLFTVAGLGGLALAYSPSLLIGSWLPVLLVAAWKRLPDRRAMADMAWATVVLVAGVVGAYLWLSGAAVRESAGELYGVAYGAWPESYAVGELGRWWGRSFYGVARFALGVEWMWPPLRWEVFTLELVAVAAALGVCWRGCRSLCLAMLILVLGIGFVGAARLWPVGAINTMTFVVPLMCILIGCGIRYLVGRLGWNLAIIVVVVGCLAVPAARAARRLNNPYELEHTRPVFEHILSDAKAGDGVFIYYAADDAFEFYWPALLRAAGREASELPVLVQPRSDRGRFEAFADRFAGFVSDHRRAWFVFTHDYDGERSAWIGHLKQTYQLLDTYEVADSSAHLVALPD